MAKITRPAAQVRQGSLKLFTTSVKVRDLRLPRFYTINKLDPEGNGKGFQRLLNRGRAKKLADYLLAGKDEGDAFLPTSIFLATSRDIPFNPIDNTITFDIAEVGPFNVVDGQHRIEGLVMAAEKDDKLLDFEIPVNIAVGLDDVSQMCHFLIVNTTQRSVDEAIEQQIVARLTKMIGVEKMPTIPKWIQRQVDKGEDSEALKIVKYLKSEPDSPWFGKIRMANDENPTATINQKSFVNSIKRYVLSSNNPLASPIYGEKRPKILLNYWKAIVELLVDADAIKPSVIFKTTGVELFHMVSATVFTNCASQQDFTREYIKTLFERGFHNLTGENVGMSAPEWWERGSDASGLNAAAVRKLAIALNHAINARDGGGSISL